MLTYRSTGVHTNRRNGKTSVKAKDRQGGPSETPAQKQQRERRESMAEATMGAGQGIAEAQQSKGEVTHAQMAQRPQGRGGVGKDLLNKYVYKGRR